MKLADLRYITQENIDEAHINITSAEMYAEAREFNIHMLRMRRKQWLFLADYWGMFILNFISVPIVALLSMASESTMLISMNAPWWSAFLFPPVFWALYAWFIFYRRVYDWRASLIFSMVMIPAGYAFFITVIGNAVITKIISKLDTELKDEVCYPEFVELRLTFIRPEQEEERHKEDPYSTYLPPPEDDSGFLFNSDISTITDKNEH